MVFLASLNPRNWPIRWQLTMLNVGVHAVTLVTLSIVFLAQMDGALVGIAADNLRDKARGVFEDRRPPPDEVGLRPPPPPFSLPRIAALVVRRLSGPDSGALIFDLDGNLVEQTRVEEDQEPWPAPPPAMLTQDAGRPGAERTMIVRQESRRVLLLIVPMPSPEDGVVGTVVLARSLELVDAVQGRLLWALVAVVVIAVVVGGTLGLRATREALRPLDRVIHVARAIEAGQLDERLRPTKHDEIGALGIALDTMLDRLAGMVASQRQFVADAAHELRTPLTALGGMVEMLQMGADRGDPNTVRRMLDTMSREIDRLSRLVADLLTLSRLDAEQPLHPGPVDLPALLSEVAIQTDVLAKGQEIAVEVERPATVIADADRLKQVLLNLTANAIRFTSAGGQIVLGLTTDDGKAIVTVSDTGSGIAPDLLPRVMDRFVRGDASRARSTGGSGLGLAIASAIVEAHGGTIEIASTLGQGTTVTISLPRTEGSSAQARPSSDLPAAVERRQPVAPS
ncbi:MAG: HAMP domain-containing protein [Chloroflexi bacterium]|nr:HAMP domain-containing protein [Chloroflexota bacterium]